MLLLAIMATLAASWLAMIATLGEYDIKLVGWPWRLIKKVVGIEVAFCALLIVAQIALNSIH